MAANSASPQTVDYPIQRDDALAAYPFIPASVASVSCVALLSGTDGTFQTLEAMAKCVRGEISPDFCGYENSSIVNFASTLIQDCENSEQEIKALFDYASKQIRYESHPIDQQIVQDACQTIRLKTGDCVSKSVLLATLLASLDYDVRFVAQYYDDKQLYSHVYVEAFDKLSQSWKPLDPVASDKPMGWTQSLPDGGFETPYDIF